MKQLKIAVLVLLLGWVARCLYVRFDEEAADRRVSILADWSEVRDEALRQGMPDVELLERLRNSGSNALLVGASTVQDYLWEGFSFSNRALAETVLRQLQDRGVVGTTLKKEGGRIRLVSDLKN